MKTPPEVNKEVRYLIVCKVTNEPRVHPMTSLTGFIAHHRSWTTAAVSAVCFYQDYIKAFIGSGSTSKVSHSFNSDIFLIQCPKFCWKPQTDVVSWSEHFVEVFVAYCSVRLFWVILFLPVFHSTLPSFLCSMSDQVLFCCYFLSLFVSFILIYVSHSERWTGSL